MEKITSIAHLDFLINQDVRYKWLVIVSYCGTGAAVFTTSFKHCYDWVKEWIVDNVNTVDGPPDTKTCKRMVIHINESIGHIERNKDKYLAEPKP